MLTENQLSDILQTSVGWGREGQLGLTRPLCCTDNGNGTPIGDCDRKH